MTLLLLLSTLALGADLTACDELRAEDPQARAGWRCYYQIARTGAYDEVMAHLRPLVLDDPEAPAWAVHTWASLVSDVADPSTGEAFAAAQQAQDERGDLLGQVYIRLNRGLYLANQGELDQGEALVAEGAARALAAGEHVLWATAHLQAARLLWKEGVRLDGVEQAARDVLAMELPDDEYQARSVALSLLASVMSETGRRGESLQRLREWAELAERHGDVLQAEIVALRILGERRGDADPSEPPDPAWLADAEALARSTSVNPNVEIGVRQFLALALAAHEPERALALAEEAVEAAGRMDTLKWTMDAISVRAEVRARRGEADAALADMAEARRLADELGWTETPQGILWTEALVREQLGDGRGALEASLAALKGLETDYAATGASLIKARYHGTYAPWYAETARRAWRVSEPELAFEVMERVHALELRERLGLDSEVADVAEVQAALRPGEVLLHVVSPDHGPGGLLRVLPDDIRWTEIPPRAALEARTALFGGALEARDDSEAAAARRLFDYLLAYVIEEDQPQRLITVPSGPLHHLPLAALRGPDGRPVAADVLVQRVPSATLWLRWRRSPAQVDRGSALLVADPLLAEEAGLPPLPRARTERVTAERRLGRAVVALEGAAATERAWQQAAPTASLLHAAAHAVVDPVHPHRSALVLAPGDGEDGRLTVAEVLDAQLADPVVVLSACRSADGPVMGGEGPMGLSRAFLHAGARAVVGTLWPVRDDEAAVIAEALLEELADGRSIGEAVAAVRARSVADEAPGAAWAGLVLIGDADQVPFPGGVRQPVGWLWWIGVGVPLLLGAGFGLRASRSPR